MSATFDASLLEGLAAQAAQLTGFSDEAILPDAIRRVAAGLARTLPPEQLLARAVARDPDVVHALCQAVSVGETYFFRHPEHFRFVSSVWSIASSTGACAMLRFSLEHQQTEHQ